MRIGEALPKSALPDILEGGLDIVFVGINPGRYSDKLGHYYAQPRNRFWPLLFESGILPRPLKAQDDWKLPRFRLGLTDVVQRTTAGSSDLSGKELRMGGEILRQKVLFYRPRILCFNGLTAYRALFKKEDPPGLQVSKIGDTTLFAIPSTSPRNARYSKIQLLTYFSALQDFRKMQKNKD